MQFVVNMLFSRQSKKHIGKERKGKGQGKERTMSGKAKERKRTWKWTGRSAICDYAFSMPCKSLLERKATKRKRTGKGKEIIL